MKKHPIYAGVIVTRPLVRSLVTPGQVGEAEARLLAVGGNWREHHQVTEGLTRKIASWGKGMPTIKLLISLPEFLELIIALSTD